MRKLNETCVDRSIQEYHKNYVHKLANFESLIGINAQKCGESVPAKSLAADNIHQAGKPLVCVSRIGDIVTIKQARFLSSYFDKATRDNRTRYTIPLLYTTNNGTFAKVFPKNETSLELNVPSNWRFALDYHYHQVYRAFYEDPLPLFVSAEKNSEFYDEMALEIRYSMLNGLEMGWINFDRYFELMRANTLGTKVIGSMEYYSIGLYVMKYVLNVDYKEDYDPKQEGFLMRYKNDSCTTLISWNDMFNNREIFSQRSGLPVKKNVNGTVYDIMCLSSWQNASTYTSFLRDNFIDGNLRIRPDNVKYLQKRTSLFRIY
ncbi:hypothetical protein PFISCL1PPCAC_18649 [Pristionchus fissidentatus]|uniref:Uncharacterized protein n=1 Tax=Pristionchus fissidentatus TaxID=1538716 RepID=A0AAV5W691_9BILA|nr:hypothetical protein PFISCL1PPCAC_18649 [Pristionchus fissidentatus]